MGRQAKIKALRRARRALGLDPYREPTPQEISAAAITKVTERAVEAMRKLGEAPRVEENK